MRYELRRWTDAEQTDYTVRASSDNEESLRDMINKPSIPNEDWYRLYIVDTQVEQNATATNR